MEKLFERIHQQSLNESKKDLVSQFCSIIAPVVNSAGQTEIRDAFETAMDKCADDWGGWFDN
jgi:hypothetical protein